MLGSGKGSSGPTGDFRIGRIHPEGPRKVQSEPWEGTAEELVLQPDLGHLLQGGGGGSERC